MIKTLAVFIDACYIVRRNAISVPTVERLRKLIAEFHNHRQIFMETGVRDTMSLPRQHALSHYVELISSFGSPNGLCSSITESKHIKAVKEPWRRSSRFKALSQMLVINSRMEKMVATRRWHTAEGRFTNPLTSPPTGGSSERSLTGAAPGDSTNLRTLGLAWPESGLDSELEVTPPDLASPAPGEFTDASFVEDDEVEGADEQPGERLLKDGAEPDHAVRSHSHSDPSFLLNSKVHAQNSATHGLSMSSLVSSINQNSPKPSNTSSPSPSTLDLLRIKKSTSIAALFMFTSPPKLFSMLQATCVVLEGFNARLSDQTRSSVVESDGTQSLLQWRHLTTRTVTWGARPQESQRTRRMRQPRQWMT